jgi:outer membrane lipoprotein-sorting protein
MIPYFLEEILFKKLLLLSSMCLFIFAVCSHAEDLDEVIQKNIAARGGIEKINALTSMKLTGQMTMTQGEKAPIVVYQKRPHFVRVEFRFKGMTGIQAYDGQTPWMINPFKGSSVPQKMYENEAKDIIEQSDFGGPLVNYKEKGNKVELLGKQDLAGRPVYKIKVTLQNGDVRYFYLDSENYLDFKITRVVKREGREVMIDTLLSDYDEINGLMVPLSVYVKIGDQILNQITWENVEFDVPMDDSMFKMPAETPQSSPSN